MCGPKEIAARGLAQSDRGWGKQGKIERAEQALRDVVSLGETEARRASLIGLAGSAAAEPHAGGRLRVLRATLTAIQSGACSSVGFQARLASDLVDAFDDYDGKNVCQPKPGRNPVIRAMLDEMGHDTAPEGAYFSYLAKLAEQSEMPRGMLNMSTRAGSGLNIDVTTPAWYSSVAVGALRQAEFQSRELQSKEPGRLLRVIDEEVPALARQRNDADALGHLDRAKRYAQLPISEDAQYCLRRETYSMIGDGVPAAPESALVLMSKVRSDHASPRDMQVLCNAAIAEARQSTYPAGNPTPAWLDYLEAVAPIDDCRHGFWRLQNGALYALSEGKPAQAASVMNDVKFYLEKECPSPQAADTLMKALLDFDRGDGSLRHAAELSLHIADAAPEPLGTHMLGTAFERLLPLMQKDSVCAAPAAAAAAAPGDAALQRIALQACIRQDKDAMGQALYRAFEDPPAAPGGIEQGEQFVMIGNLKIPKRVLQPSH